jgi:hypothetical protein
MSDNRGVRTLALTVLAVIAPALALTDGSRAQNDKTFDDKISANARQMFDQGKQIFRFETFGDEAYWAGTLKLHKAIAGSKFGGIGPGVSPKTALAVGLKVDMDALPATLVSQVKQGKVNLDDAATTLALLKLQSVVGIIGNFSQDGSPISIGVGCAICHSTVDNAFAPGIGHRLDGWPNRDLNVGAIGSLAPDLSVFTKLLGADEGTVRNVLASWGPGKFDAELNLDGKAFRPDQRLLCFLLPSASQESIITPGLVAGVTSHTGTPSLPTLSCRGEERSSMND